MSRRQLSREMKAIRLKPPDGCSAGPSNSDLYKWDATIIGPSDTPYEGGVFKLKMTFSQKYPFVAPNVVFKTKIYHPNIDSKGNICLDILKDQWSPVLKIPKLLMSIRSLLADPNPKDPLATEPATLFLENRPKYDKTVRLWVQKYASGDKTV
jgi:ubiquitin-conjugating enzyme E2 D